MSTFNKDYEKEEKEEVIKLNPTKKEVETKLKLKYILCIVIVCLAIIAYQYYKELNRIENEIQSIQENKINEIKSEEDVKEEKEENESSNIENVIEDIDIVIDNGHIVNNDVDISKMTVDEVTDMLIQDATNIVEDPNTYFDTKTEEYMQDATKKLEDAKSEFLNSVDENNLTEKEEKALQMLNAVEDMLYEYNY